MSISHEIYAFDECSILHMCNLNIRDAFKIFFPKDFIAHKNSKQLNILLEHLREKNKVKAKFVPNENFDENLVRSYNDLLQKQGNVQILGASFKKEILEQLEKFYEKLSEEFINIEKNEDIGSIKTFFISNQRPLKKNPKIPKDDDLKIIFAYCDYNSIGKKYFITEDEHFWGYEDIIETEYNFFVIKEWECDKLVGVNS